MARYQAVLAGSETVVVDFFASWCRPCDLILPKYQELASRFPATFIKVDIDEVPGVAQLANVRAMPTFHVYKHGKRIAEMVGADKYKLEEMIKRTV
ncbi:thioredoxin-like protein [Cladochytrium replicatum]|nr:thioredoxin-like protein [Cladochytrium replicatum]